MAVKITKLGAMPGEKYETVCTICKTEFTFLQSDGKISSDRNDLIICIKCPHPECGNTCCVNLN